ncbi:MAG: hypothetical protein JSV03_14815 [Planctomycetota bacterium]|nr:MAG: hypothetical protein JSV03_14815 [Planctomycetota bacterium]
MSHVNNVRQSWLRTLWVVVLFTAIVCTAGCNPLTLIGSASSINLVIPLGLDGGFGLLNPFGSTTPSEFPSIDDTTSDSIPPPPEYFDTGGTTE